MKKRKLVLDGVTYEAVRETDRMPEGCSRLRWYAVILDPQHGSCIDERVPSGYFTSMRECHNAIHTHHNSHNELARQRAEEMRNRTLRDSHG